MSVQIVPAGATEDHLVFSQQPKDGDERTPEPTQVKIEDSKNHVVTTATDGVTLFDQGEDVGYVPFVRGVAAFTGANAPILFAGTQPLVAEETNAAHQFSGSAGQVTSTSFHISELHLAFTRQPIFTGANVPFTVAVQLEDDKDKPVKVPEADPLIQINALNETTGQISGQTTTGFDANRRVTVTILSLGTFQLVASEYVNGGSIIDPTQNALSAPINVLGNHLRFLKQPGDIDVGDPASFIVGLVDYKNKLVSPTGLKGSLYALLGSDAGPGGIVPITLINGKYDNSKSTDGSPLIVPTAGSFSITVADLIPGTDNDPGDGISPLTTLTFQAVAPHLVFTRQPKMTGAYAPVSFAVELLNRKNKPVYPNTGGEISVTLSTNDNFTSSSNVMLQHNKDDNLKPAAGQASVSVPLIGTVVVSVAQVDAETGNVINSAPQVQSTPFPVVADRLVFKRQPSTVAANTPVPFEVVVEDPKNQPLTLPTDFADGIFFGLDTGPGSGAKFIFTGFEFSTGQFNNLTDGGDSAIKIGGPGTYTLTAELGSIDTKVDPDFLSITSKVFKIK